MAASYYSGNGADGVAATGRRLLLHGMVAFHNQGNQSRLHLLRYAGIQRLQQYKGVLEYLSRYGIR